VLINVFVIGYLFFKFEGQKQRIINGFELERQSFVYNLGYTIGLFVRDKVLSESFPDGIRNYLNELVRNNKNLDLILIADSLGNVIYSSNVAYENKNINELFSENITSLVNYQLKSSKDKIILNMPISEFNKKLLYIRIEYKKEGRL
jgi:hypothetical protein